MALGSRLVGRLPLACFLLEEKDAFAVEELLEFVQRLRVFVSDAASRYICILYA
jgi:hypothetical protein